MSLILKKGYYLYTEDSRGYIKSNKYSLPITGKVAIFLSLLNGTCEIEEIQRIMVDINLFTIDTISQFSNFVVNRYATLLEEDDPKKDNQNRKYKPHDFINIKNPIDEKLSMTYPDSILYLVTYNCDKSCIYCYMGKSSSSSLETDALSYNELITILDEAAAMGVSHIAMSGGEPFIRKDLAEIIVYAHSIGMKINVTTKFNLTEHQLKKLEDLKKLELDVSYDCHIDSIASYLTGSKNQATKMDKMISKLIKHNINFTICPVVTSLTYPYFKDFIIHLEKLGVKKLRISKYENSMGSSDDNLLITDAQWKEIISYSNNFHGLNIVIHDKNIPSTSTFIDDDILYDACSNGRYCMPITPDGKAILCEKVKNPLDFCFGDLRKNSFEEVWKSKERINLIFPKRDYYINNSCYDCIKFDNCMLKRKCIFSSILESGTAYCPTNKTKKTCSYYKKATE